MNTLSAFTTPAPAAEPGLWGHEARAALQTLEQLNQRQAEVADVLRRQRRELLHWQDQLLRQSVRLLVQRARIDWGLLPGLPARPPVTPVEAAPWASHRFPLAHQLICRTGCESEGHHWRQGAHCRRTGSACDQPGEEDPT